MRYVIGVDIGTSGTKTVLFDEKGNAVSSFLVEYPLYQPKIGWAEQDPEDWWNATYTSINNVIKQSGVNPADIKGIGLSGQMHGLVMLDKDGNVLRKSIIWCDQRTTAEADELTEKVGKERLVEITGNPAQDSLLLRYFGCKRMSLNSMPKLQKFYFLRTIYAISSPANTLLKYQTPAVCSLWISKTAVGPTKFWKNSI